VSPASGRRLSFHAGEDDLGQRLFTRVAVEDQHVDQRRCYRRERNGRHHVERPEQDADDRARDQHDQRRQAEAASEHMIADQQAAAVRRDATEFTKDYYAGNNAQDAMTKTSKAAGLPICSTAAGA
jgi:hypothetical protein